MAGPGRWHVVVVRSWDWVAASDSRLRVSVWVVGRWEASGVQFVFGVAVNRACKGLSAASPPTAHSQCKP